MQFFLIARGLCPDGSEVCLLQMPSNSPGTLPQVPGIFFLVEVFSGQSCRNFRPFGNKSGMISNIGLGQSRKPLSSRNAVLVGCREKSIIMRKSRASWRNFPPAELLCSPTGAFATEHAIVAALCCEWVHPAVKLSSSAWSTCSQRNECFANRDFRLSDGSA